MKLRIQGLFYVFLEQKSPHIVELGIEIYLIEEDVSIFKKRKKSR